MIGLRILPLILMMTMTVNSLSIYSPQDVVCPKNDANIEIYHDYDVNIEATTGILMEASTGLVIYEKDADKPLPPASITKVMTLLLAFEAIEKGKINLTDEVCISEYASSMGGSQVYLEPGEVQTVETLIKCIAISSANDASVALGEYIAGTEDAFVSLMNDKATELGMRNTTFKNCCGLDEDGHVTSARDIALMSKELINNYPQIHQYSTTWTDTITHTTKRGSTSFGLTNTNKLLKQYDWATGLKTGSTSNAGFCLSATASKNNIELIAVVMNCPSGKARVNDCIQLLNYGYSKVKCYTDNNPPQNEYIKIKGGKESMAHIVPQNDFSFVYLDNVDISQIERTIEKAEVLPAPLNKGDIVGRAIYTYDGVPLGSVELIVENDIFKANFSDYLSRMAKCFFMLAFN